MALTPEDLAKRNVDRMKMDLSFYYGNQPVTKINGWTLNITKDRAGFWCLSVSSPPEHWLANGEIDITKLDPEHSIHRSIVHLPIIKSHYRQHFDFCSTEKWILPSLLPGEYITYEMTKEVGIQFINAFKYMCATCGKWMVADYCGPACVRPYWAPAPSGNSSASSSGPAAVDRSVKLCDKCKEKDPARLYCGPTCS
jgi:hypothetical protein